MATNNFVYWLDGMEGGAFAYKICPQGQAFDHLRKLTAGIHLHITTKTLAYHILQFFLFPQSENNICDQVVKQVFEDRLGNERGKKRKEKTINARDERQAHAELNVFHNLSKYIHATHANRKTILKCNFHFTSNHSYLTLQKLQVDCVQNDPRRQC